MQSTTGWGKRLWSSTLLLLRPLSVLARALLQEWKPLLAGVVGALLVQAFVINVYGVRKHSMEPTLRAEEGRSGDRVVVFKLAYLLEGPRRWELCVFQKEREGHNVVKRVIGLPGEWIRIEDGDVWLGPAPSDLGLLKKTPEELVRLLVPLADLSQRPLRMPLDASWVFDAEQWVQEQGHLLARPTPDAPARLEWRGLLHGGYLGDSGEIHLSTTTIRDFGCELELEPLEEGASLTITLEALGRTFQARFEPGRVVYLRADGKDSVQVPLPVQRPGRPLSVAFFQADLRLFLRVGAEWHLEDLAPWPTLLELSQTRPRWNGLSLEVAGAPARLHSLRVLRDLYYTDIQGGRHGTGRDPAFCDEGEYYLLGDNSGVSEDSRHYGPIKESGLVGKPLMVLLPLRRLKWL